MQLLADLREALQATRDVAVLAVLPFVVALLRWNDLVRLGTDTSRVFSISFPLPHSFVTFWSFVQPPTDAGGGIDPTTLPAVVGVAFGAAFLLSLAAYVVVTGLLLAGYLGSIDQSIRTGRFDFVANVRRYARSMVAYEALMLVVLGAIVLLPLLTTAPFLFPVAFVGVYVVGYLTYLVPYLVVASEDDLLEAIRHSAGLTTSRADAALAFLGFAVPATAFSLPLSRLAYTDGMLTAVAAAAVVAPVGLVVAVFFVLVARRLDEGADQPTAT
jgi:hypothetical protein